MEHCTLQSLQSGRSAGERRERRHLPHSPGGRSGPRPRESSRSDFIVYRASSVQWKSRDDEIGLFYGKLRTGRNVLLHGLKLFTSIVSVLGQIFSCSYFFPFGRMVKNKQSAAAVGRFCPIFCICVMKQ